MCKNVNNAIYLLCEQKNIEFYKKLGFKIDNNVQLLDKDVKYLSLMSYNNNCIKFKKIKYYN